MRTYPVIVTTKYHGPTNHNGSRISASNTYEGRKYFPYNYRLDTRDNHQEAAASWCAAKGHKLSSIEMNESTETGYVFIAHVEE